MRKIVVIIGFHFAALCFVACSFAEDSIYCGMNLLEVGETKESMIQKCGEPVSVQEIGYDFSKGKNKVYKIEQYIYGPWGGWNYVIKVTGGRITSIEGNPR